MATPIRGLKVSSSFADIQDQSKSLKSLNLDLKDLDRIRDISTENVSSADIRTISSLESDVEKIIIGMSNEVVQYENILSVLQDGSRRFDGNIQISGQIIAPSFKFKTVDFSANNQIKTVDLSTSRASAWSSFGDPEESIFYGGDLIVEGANSAIELSSIEIDQTINKVRFASQIPSHKIRVKIDGEDYDLFAMKGIPLRFRAFFRTGRGLTATYTSVNNIKASWVIRNIDDGREFVYPDKENTGTGTRTSQISLFDTTSKERDIELYYPVANIRSLTLNEVRVRSLPDVTLSGMTSLSLVNGDLPEMPNVNTLYPALTTLNLAGNDLTRSNDPNLRKFSPEVINRIKNAPLTSLNISRCYSNECTADLSKIPSLVTFTAVSDITNARRMSGTSPKIAAVNMQTYNITRNRFSELHSSVAASTTLKTLRIRNNGITGSITLNGASLETFVSGAGNTHNIIDVANKTSLITYISDEMTFPSGQNNGTNIFSGCTALDYIDLGNTNVTGNLPNFSDNTSLKSFYSPNTRWQDATASYSIGSNTFGPDDGGCRGTLENFVVSSSQLVNPIDDTAFRGMSKLKTLIFRSFGKGVSGSIPSSIADCYGLQRLVLSGNKLTGAVPTFATNQNLVEIDLSSNTLGNGDGGSLTAFPSLTLPKLKTLSIQNNRFTSIGKLQCPVLTQLSASSNRIASFPDFSAATSIQNILLNSNPDMSYSAGALSSITSLRRLELANCNLSTSRIDQIIKDLNANYEANQRGSVVINLVGNSPRSDDPIVVTYLNRLRAAGWTISGVS